MACGFRILAHLKRTRVTESGFRAKRRDALIVISASLGSATNGCSAAPKRYRGWATTVATTLYGDPASFGHESGVERIFSLFQVQLLPELVVL